MRYVARGTNVLGGQRYEVVAQVAFICVDAIPGTEPTIMDIPTFQERYEPATTPPRDPATAVAAPSI